MKKTCVSLLAFLMAAFVSVSFVSCGGDGDDGKTAPTPTVNPTDDDPVAPAVVTYSLYLDASGLTGDNLKFFRYKYSLTGTQIIDKSFTERGIITIAENQPLKGNEQLVVYVERVDNLEQLVERDATYTLATPSVLRVRMVTSEGNVYETSANTTNNVTCTGRQFLANVDYFCQNVSFVFDGNNVQQNTTERPNWKEPEIEISEGEAIDLGLSVLWASENVVIRQQVHNQNYFAWGETKSKNDYTWNTYSFFNGSTFTKYYFSDAKSRLDLSDDVANVVLGGNWRMPTKAEFQELLTKCKWNWGKRGGWEGYQVVGPNGNSIFFATYGYLGHNSIELYGQALGNHTLGYYPSSELASTSSSDKYAYQIPTVLKIESSGPSLSAERERCLGFTVRAVMPK